MNANEILPLLRDVLGSAVETAACTLIREMDDYWVWEVVTLRPSQRLVVKLAGTRAPRASAFERTAAVHRLVRASTAVPIPEVVAADESCQKWPWRYFIKTYLPGKEWAGVAKTVAPEALRQARFELGEAVAALHQISFAGFGELDPLASVPDPLPSPAALARRVHQMIPSPPARDYVLAMLDSNRDLFLNIHTSALAHEDLHWYNLLLNEENGAWRLAGILDFEKAWAGDREIDLARMDLWHMTGPEFWTAYRNHLPLDKGYAQRELIYQLIWCIEFAEDSPIQIEITRRLCRSLGLPVIKSFEPFQVKR